MADESILIHLDNDDIAELMSLAKAARKLPTILELIAQTEIQISPLALAARISKKTSLPSDNVSSVIWALTQIFRARESLDSDINTTLEAITHNLTRLAKTSEQKNRLKVWLHAQEQISRSLNSIGEDHPILLSFIAFRSSFSRPNAVVGMDISTSAHPIFDKSGSKIILNVIGHALRLEYHAGPGHQHGEIRLSLDNDDIEMLSYICETAREQAKILKNDLAKAPWPTACSMEPDGDSASEE